MTSIVNSAQAKAGISAVLLPCANFETAALDLAAVLAGLVGDRFEIILVCDQRQVPAQVSDLLARAPHLPLRVVNGSGVGEGCAAARYELVFIAARDGQFDVRELNRLLDAVERGADVALGYRRRWADGFVRQLQKVGVRVALDWAFFLARRQIWCAAAQTSDWPNLVGLARRRGYRVAEVPVSRKFYFSSQREEFLLGR